MKNHELESSEGVESEHGWRVTGWGKKKQIIFEMEGE